MKLIEIYRGNKIFTYTNNHGIDIYVGFYINEDEDIDFVEYKTIKSVKEYLDANNYSND